MSAQDGWTSRQGFLGPRAQSSFQAVRVAVVGLGGGGSHIVQQLAHIGFSRLLLCDPDVVEPSNLNRLIGATQDDASRSLLKVDIATRLVVGINPHSKVESYAARWEDCASALRRADFIFGCLDSYLARRDLEAFARRFLIPLIDIGMDVHAADGAAPQMSGQVILSMPGEPCMHCLGFLNEKTLAQEAADYGAVGVRPQVVWANGLLASTAVGLAVNLLTGWINAKPCLYLEYDGNKPASFAPHARLNHLPLRCEHFLSDQVGDPRFTRR